MGIEPVGQRVISINVNELNRSSNSRNNASEKPMSFADALRLLDSELEGTNNLNASNSNRSWTA